MADVFDRYAHPIKLVLSDLDGTITADELGPLDCGGLAGLRRYNERARAERAVPPVSIVSGRPHSYVEAFARFIATPLPSLFESGCGLHFPDRPLGREYEFHPALAEPAVVEACARFRAWAAEELLRRRGAGFIIGKQLALSYAPSASCSVDELLAATEAMPADLRPRFIVSRSAAVVDVTPDPVDKAAGVRWLVDHLRRERAWDLTAANVAGVGDSFNDLSFLDAVGVSCAVAGAFPEVRARVAYCARADTAEGVAEVVERAIALNRRLGYT